MPKPIVEVASLSKLYRIGTRERINRTLRETITDLLASPLKNLRNMRRVTRVEEDPYGLDVIWALRNVSFEVQPGEVVGIIGRNGAGKSTLLKILSHITDPSSGEARLYGRVASLLEIGTGFHQELTGRENIFLNGAILGMRKAEIASKFDQIVDFSGIEKFIDTPVKRYSSGMYVRLAFAVAAHLESEILVVDEVLAVGDASFQKKCLGKMQDISSQEGRTILFVSHNMPAVRKFCSRGILLEAGEVLLDGEVNSVANHYLESGQATKGSRSWERGDRPGNASLQVVSAGLRDLSGSPAFLITISQDLQVDLTFEVATDGAIPQFSLMLLDAEGNNVFSSLNNKENNEYGKPLPRGLYKTTCLIPGNLLNAGRFFISFACFSGGWTDGFRVENVLSFDAIDDGVLKGDYPGTYGGYIRPSLRWTTVGLTTGPE